MLIMVILIFRFRKNITHGIYVQQIYRRWKNETNLPPKDFCKLQTMQDSNYYYIILITCLIIIEVINLNYNSIF